MVGGGLTGLLQWLDIIGNLQFKNCIGARMDDFMAKKRKKLGPVKGPSREEFIKLCCMGWDDVSIDILRKGAEKACIITPLDGSMNDKHEWRKVLSKMENLESEQEQQIQRLSSVQQTTRSPIENPRGTRRTHYFFQDDFDDESLFDSEGSEEEYEVLNVL